MSPIEWFVINKVKDHHFHASLRFVMCNYIFPIYYLLILLIVTLIFDWGVGIATVSGMAVLSYIGILVKDKLNYNKKRNKVKKQVADFTAFDLKITEQVTTIKELLS